MNWLKQNWFHLFTILGLLLIGFSLLFSQVIKPIINEKRLDKCLKEFFVLSAESLNIETKDRDSLKPEEQFLILLPEEFREICFKRYQIQ